MALVIFWRFRAATHTFKKIYCAEMAEDKPRQPADKISCIKRGFQQCML